MSLLRILQNNQRTFVYQEQVFIITSYDDISSLNHTHIWIYLTINLQLHQTEHLEWYHSITVFLPFRQKEELLLNQEVQSHFRYQRRRIRDWLNADCMLCYDLCWLSHRKVFLHTGSVSCACSYRNTCDFKFVCNRAAFWNYGWNLQPSGVEMDVTWGRQSVELTDVTTTLSGLIHEPFTTYQTVNSVKLNTPYVQKHMQVKSTHIMFHFCCVLCVSVCVSAHVLLSWWAWNRN